MASDEARFRFRFAEQAPDESASLRLRSCVVQEIDQLAHNRVGGDVTSILFQELSVLLEDGGMVLIRIVGHAE